MPSVTTSYRVALRRGDQFDFSMRHLSDGSPTDLTGFDAEMIISWPAYRSTAGHVAAGNVQATTNNGRITLGGVAGTIDVHLDASLTADIPRGGPSVAWQLRIFTNDEDKETLLSGDVFVLENHFEAAE